MLVQRLKSSYDLTKLQTNIVRRCVFVVSPDLRRRITCYRTPYRLLLTMKHKATVLRLAQMPEPCPLCPSYRWSWTWELARASSPSSPLRPAPGRCMPWKPAPCRNTLRSVVLPFLQPLSPILPHHHSVVCCRQRNCTGRSLNVEVFAKQYFQRKFGIETVPFTRNVLMQEQFRVQQISLYV